MISDKPKKDRESFLNELKKDIGAFSNYIKICKRKFIKNFNVEYKLFITLKTALFWYLIVFISAAYIDGDINHKFSFIFWFSWLGAVYFSAKGIINYIKRREDALFKSKFSYVFMSVLAILPNIVIILAYSRAAFFLGLCN
ncbi:MULTISPECIES: hypothetical protein [Glaesserella]|uniref:Uncharacterized protein n=1 Tax=Glaesserella australis TaxID=2094024 RepID=A0A328C1X9_9PAST|nr:MULTISPECIES: hypothetical protein [Glaesserella]AUI66280.1 hypothetical protein CJD39_06635 [Glaesserella sp. 15-184]RAL19302.1 hypothetical protein C5N92_04060 [Glaesserella australis]